MKIFFLGFLVVFITSCASIDSNRIAPGYKEAYISIKEAFFGIDNVIQPDLIRNIPYASMLVRIGNGPRALMILESINNDDYSWVSADGVYLIINKGKIVKTHGLTNNLIDRLSSFEGWNNDLYTGEEFFSYDSYRNPVLNNLKVSSVYLQKNKKTIELLLGNKELKLVEERISSKEVGWFKVNKYWLDDNNFVWKSIQHVSPRLPEIHIEVTKKPR